jgi:hypothetical protein
LLPSLDRKTQYQRVRDDLSAARLLGGQSGYEALPLTRKRIKDAIDA